MEGEITHSRQEYLQGWMLLGVFGRSKSRAMWWFTRNDPKRQDRSHFLVRVSKDLHWLWRGLLRGLWRIELSVAYTGVDV